MTLRRIDNALAVCKTHLDGTDTRGTEIESYLVAYLLTLVASEYEQRVEALFSLRAMKCGDPHVHSFVTSACGRIIRSPRCSEIAGALGMFDAKCKTDFQAKVNNQACQTSYDKIITNRQLVAHLTGSNMTFAELERDAAESIMVLEAVVDALGLLPGDLAALP
jgi:hypothetical protein